MRTNRVTVAELIAVELIRYAPLPLTYTDLEEELDLTRKHAQLEVGKLVRRGYARRDGGKGCRNVLIYATPHLESAYERWGAP